MKLLSPGLELRELPVFPQVHDGSHESLRMEKLLPGDQRLVIRLWPAYIKLTPDAKMLWVGLVGEQQKVEIFNIVAFAAGVDSPVGAFAQFERDTSGILEQRRTATGVMLMRINEEAPD